ncbi:unnamed protein product, partial [Hapterophycus canaliculatus]
MGNTGEGGALSVSLTVPIYVSSLNHPPRVGREEGLILDGVENEKIKVDGIVVVDQDAGDGRLRMTIEALYGKAHFGGAYSGLEIEEEDSLLGTTIDLHGTLQALNKALEDLSFIPDNHSNAMNVDGLASLNVTVNDLGLSGEGGAQQSEPLIIHMIFEAVNDGPLLHLPDHFAAREDVPLFVPGISVSDTDSDEPGGDGLMEISLSVGNGTLALVSTGSVCSAGALAGPSITFQGSQNTINDALTGLVYLGTPDWSGPDILSLNITDLGNVGTGGSLAASGRVQVTVLPVND